MNTIEYNKLYTNAKAEQKRATCKICGKPCTSFCKSHTLPQMVLENLANDGMVNSFFFDGNPSTSPNVMKPEYGVKNAGVFYEICRDCDSKVFQEYENNENLSKEPSDKMLNLIALKSSLFYYYKYRIEQIADHKLLNSVKGHEIIDQNNITYEQELDADIKECIKNITCFSHDNFKVLFWKKLNYIVPIAFQGLIEPLLDFNGDRIFGKKPTTFIVIAPLENCSIVCLFCKNKKDEYSKLNFPLNASPSKKLSLINNMVLSCSEDFFINKNLFKNITVKETEILKTICYKLEFHNLPSFEMKRDLFKNCFKYPNLLNEKYKI